MNREFIANALPWLLFTVALIAVIVLFFLVKILRNKNRKVRKSELEYKFGKESEFFLDFQNIQPLYDEYQTLGGDEETAAAYLVLNLAKELQKAESFTHADKVFKGFRFYHSLSEKVHERLLPLTQKKIVAIAETEFEGIKLDTLIKTTAQVRLDKFKKDIMQHHYAAYELPGMFYERLKKRHEEVQKMKPEIDNTLIAANVREKGEVMTMS